MSKLLKTGLIKVDVEKTPTEHPMATLAYTMGGVERPADDERNQERMRDPHVPVKEWYPGFAEDRKKLMAIRSTVGRYHQALADRENGTIAVHRAIAEIEDILEIHWRRTVDIPSKKKFKVGVFPESAKSLRGKDRKRRYLAYTRWYSPEWDGCIEVEVEAENGTQARKLAIEKVRQVIE